MMWDIYDALIDGIPEDITVTEVICGITWTWVYTNEGGVGLAMTTDVQTVPQTRDSYVGSPLRDVASCVKSWNFREASVGMAAINAFYNTRVRLTELNSRQPDRRFCSFDIPHEGKRVSLVGALRYPPNLFDSAKSLTVMERAQINGTLPDSACEYFLPDSDLVIITGSAFVNKTMPRLLELCKTPNVLITGPSTPMAPALFDFGVRRLTGLIVTDLAGCHAFAAEGRSGPPYRFGERYCLDAPRPGEASK